LVLSEYLEMKDSKVLKEDNIIKEAFDLAEFLAMSKFNT
jgi:hypothetical protein